MRQKLALAQAFMEDEQVLILDEPFNALDRESSRITHALLSEFHTQGRTIVFTSHAQADVTALATRELYLENGTVIPG